MSHATGRADSALMAGDAFVELLARLAGSPARSISTYIKGTVSQRSFPEVRADVLRMIAALGARGVRQGSRVGICAENSYAWLVCDLALTAMRCVSVAFPPGDRPSLSDPSELGVHLLVVDAAVLAKAERIAPSIAVLGETGLAEDGAVRGHAAAVAPDPFSQQPDDHSYVFSSGTAGQRKGLAISRAGSVSLIQSFSDAFEMRTGDSILVFMPLWSYQQRLFAYAAFLHGFDVLLVPPSIIFRGLRELRPTIVIGPPMLFEALRSQGGDLVQALGGHSRVLISGMAKIPAATTQAFAASGCPIYEVYGLTECGVISANTPRCSQPGSVGRPLPGTNVSLAADGEIVVRKTHPLARGYFLDASMGRDTRFTPEGLFTGDLGEMDSNGFLHLTGRKKNTVVLAGGQKLQPEPVEALLENCPGVRNAVVFASDSDSYPSAIVDVGGQLTAEARTGTEAALDAVSRDQPDWARIARFIIAPRPFSREDGTLTEAMKVNRARVVELYG